MGCFFFTTIPQPELPLRRSQIVPPTNIESHITLSLVKGGEVVSTKPWVPLVPPLCSKWKLSA